MANTKDASTGITAAAEAVGSALGHVAGTVDRLKAEHPHPIDEAREALAQGQAVVKDTAAAASEGVSAVIDTARKAVATVRKTAARTRPRVDTRQGPPLREAGCAREEGGPARRRPDEEDGSTRCRQDEEDGPSREESCRARAQTTPSLT